MRFVGNKRSEDVAFDLKSFEDIKFHYKKREFKSAFTMLQIVATVLFLYKLVVLPRYKVANGIINSHEKPISSLVIRFSIFFITLELFKRLNFKN